MKRALMRYVLAAALIAGVFGCATRGTSIRTQVWLDVDVAAGLPRRDVDDALAMIQAFHAPSLTVRGVSAVYGNAPLRDGLPIAREVVERFGPAGMIVHAGAAGPDELGESNDAVEAMALALIDAPMTILALGPLTNIGSLLRLHPALSGRIEAIVMVAARRPGQRFTYPGAGGQAFQDFNFENDPEAMQTILDTEIDLVFAPWEVSSHVWITPEDLETLREGGGSGAWIAEKSQSWIAMWRDDLGQRGFNPFDTLGVGWVTHPRLIDSMRVEAWIEMGVDDTVASTEGTPRTKPYLLVRESAAGERDIVYTYRPKPGFKSVLLEGLGASEAHRRQ